MNNIFLFVPNTQPFPCHFPPSSRLSTRGNNLSVSNLSVPRRLVYVSMWLFQFFQTPVSVSSSVLFHCMISQSLNQPRGFVPHCFQDTASKSYSQSQVCWGLHLCTVDNCTHVLLNHFSWSLIWIFTMWKKTIQLIEICRDLYIL